MAKKIKIKKKQATTASNTAILNAARNLDVAFQFCQAGNLLEAELISRQILQNQPNNPDAWHLLGLVAYKEGDYDNSAGYIRKSIHINPDNHSCYNSLGLVLADKGLLDDAIDCYRKALILMPDNSTTYNNLGLALKKKGLFSDASGALKKALALDPHNAELFHNLGLVFGCMSMPDEAVRCFKEALSISPDYAEAYNNLAVAFNEKSLSDNAIESARKALELKPDDAEAYNNLAVAFNEKGLPDNAIECSEKALELKPDYADAYNNLGIAFCDNWQMDMAIANYKKAIALRSDFDKAYNNLAVALNNKGLPDEAVESQLKALELAPHNPWFHNSLGMLYLCAMDFEKGWEEYEWRLKALKVAPLTKPAWDGNPLDNRDILVYAEQGYGDTLQFCRYLPLLHDLGARRVLFKLNNKGLEQLLKESDLMAEILDLDTPVDSLDFDTNIHLLSLPRIFKTNLENIPFRQKRYLKADTEKVEIFRENIFKIQDSGFKIQPLKIGIFWQGNPALKPDRNRSMPLQHFYQICRLPGVRVYSLQKGPGVEQLDNLPVGIEITSLGESFNDFSDTAAAIMNLDLVITVDTAIGHLSGALGKKTWVLLPSHGEWRWHLDMDHSPWYEDMRLFRHKEPGKKDWDEVMIQVKVKVEEEIRNWQKRLK